MKTQNTLAQHGTLPISSSRNNFSSRNHSSCSYLDMQLFSHCQSSSQFLFLCHCQLFPAFHQQFCSQCLPVPCLTVPCLTVPCLTVPCLTVHSFSSDLFFSWVFQGLQSFQRNRMSQFVVTTLEFIFRGNTSLPRRTETTTGTKNCLSPYPLLLNCKYLSLPPLPSIN